MVSGFFYFSLNTDKNRFYRKFTANGQKTAAAAQATAEIFMSLSSSQKDVCDSLACLRVCFLKQVGVDIHRCRNTCMTKPL